MSLNKEVQILENAFLDIEERNLIQEQILSTEYGNLFRHLVNGFVYPSLEDVYAVVIPSVLSFDFGGYRFTASVPDELRTEHTLIYFYEEYLYDCECELERRLNYCRR